MILKNFKKITNNWKLYSISIKKKYFLTFILKISNDYFFIFSIQKYLNNLYSARKKKTVNSYKTIYCIVKIAIKLWPTVQFVISKIKYSDNNLIHAYIHIYRYRSSISKRVNIKNCLKQNISTYICIFELKLLTLKECWKIKFVVYYRW